MIRLVGYLALVTLFNFCRGKQDQLVNLGSDRKAEGTVHVVDPSIHNRYEKAWTLVSEFIGCQTAVRKNNEIATSQTIDKEYRVVLEFKANEEVSVWASIIHFTTGANIGIYGARVPAVFFSGTSIQICSAVNGDDNFYKNYKISLNEWHSVEIMQVRQGEGYVYSVFVDGNKVVNVVNTRPQVFHNVKVYAGDPWHTELNGFIRKLDFYRKVISAMSSSVYQDNTNLWGPQLAWVGGSMTDHGFFYSKHENNPWLKIHVYALNLSSITITNRKDCCGVQLKNIEVRAGLSSELFGNEIVGTFKGPGYTGGKHMISFKRTMLAAYITIQLKAANNLQINGIIVNEVASGMRCTGQENGCCTKDTPCNTEEGDCDNDQECAGNLRCGINNCLWGGEDDCCAAQDLIGTWDTTYDDGDKATYLFSKDGSVYVPYCDFNCHSITHSITEVSYDPAYPSGEGWRKINKIHRLDVWLYVRVKDQRLEVMYFSYYGAYSFAAIGIRRVATTPSSPPTTIATTTKAAPGTRHNPGVSCKMLKENNKALKSGLFWIVLNETTEVYCDMDTGEGGWILIGKAVVASEKQAADVYWANIISDDTQKLAKVTNGQFLLSASGLTVLREHTSFTQIRFYCDKKYHGRVVHIHTLDNSLGRRVVEYMLGKGTFDERPSSCDSFATLSDDSSTIGSKCEQWEGRRWYGYGNSSARMYNLPMDIPWYNWFYLGNTRNDINCDDFFDEDNFSPIGEFRFYVK